jgi:Uma2 family endonuclease
MIEIPDTLMDRALVDDDALIELSAALRPARVERLDGKIVVSPGTGGETGRRNSRLTRLLDQYAETHDFVSFDSSTGFHMPDHDTPSADHALLRNERWALLSPEEKTKLPPVAPDVIVELCSENERGRTSIVTKCERWFGYGVGYVVLIDPFSQTIRAWGTAPDEFPDLSTILKM